METYSTIDQTEMKKLASGLMDRNIHFSVDSFWGGLQIRCKDWDAICHDYSSGNEDGLIEIMGLPECDGDVIGYLTADDVLAMVDKLLKVD